MEAVLLPSAEFRAFCAENIVVAVRRSDEAAERLRKEFGIPTHNLHVVVLDGRGEWLASFVADTVGAECSEENAKKYPALLLAAIRKSLKVTVSVQELERRCAKDPGDNEGFSRLERRLREMSALHRLADLYEGLAARENLEAGIRKTMRIRAFRIRHTGSVPKSEIEREETLMRGERLLVEVAGHPEAEGLVDTLFQHGTAGCFDVPAKIGRVVARLRKAAGEQKDAGPLEKHVERLSKALKDWTREMRSAYEKTDRSEAREAGRLYYAAVLGDAGETVRLASKTPWRDIPRYQGWLREAKEKLSGKKPRKY